MVSISSMMMMCLTLIICFGVPLGLFWFIRRRYQASIKSFFVGLIVFIKGRNRNRGRGHTL